MFYTSFAQLKEHEVCTERYRYLAKTLGSIDKYGKNTPIPLAKILEVNGLDDAIWAFRACPGHEKIARLFACACAAEVLPIFEREYPTDSRPRSSIATARKFANGEATTDESSAARDAARDAAGAAAGDKFAIILKDLLETE